MSFISLLEEEARDRDVGIDHAAFHKEPLWFACGLNCSEAAQLCWHCSKPAVTCPNPQLDSSAEDQKVAKGGCIVAGQPSTQRTKLAHFYSKGPHRCHGEYKLQPFNSQLSSLS